MAKRRVAVGVDLGGTSLRAVVADETGEVLGRGDAKTQPHEGEAAVIERLREVIRAARREAGVKRGDLLGVGVGVPGAVDAGAGEVRFAPNLDWRGVPLGRDLEAELQLPVRLDNDVNVAVLGEQRFGAARGRQDVLGVWVGTGVGGGLLVGGQLVRGFHGSAAELGHTILLPHGPPCGCGSRGCVEALASRTAIETEIRRRLARGEASVVPEILESTGKTRLTSGVLSRALAAEDSLVQQVMADAQRYLGMAIASWLNVLDSEAVLVGGGVAEKLGRDFLDPVAEASERHRFPTGGEPPAYLLAALGDDSGILGAASLLF